MIDLGSNAVRFVLAEEAGDEGLRVTTKIREPIRVGADVFARGYISEQTKLRLFKAFEKFRQEIEKWPHVKLKAVATSAFREALNGKDIAEEIRAATNLPLKIISGKEEAKLIQGPLLDLDLVRQNNVLLMDIGGGSIELTAVAFGTPVGSKSFPIGTVRLLQNFEKEKLESEAFRNYVREQISMAESFVDRMHSKVSFDFCVGTGGNFEELYSLKKQVFAKKNGGFLNLKTIDRLSEILEAMSFAERVETFKLRQDRADVIIPAVLMARFILEQSGTNKFLIPRIGLKDGLLSELART